MFGNLKRKCKRSEQPEADGEGLYTRLRATALGLNPSEVGLAATDELPRAVAVVMDTVYPAGAATLVAIADGTTSLYVSPGGGTIGAGQHPAVAAATHQLLALAEATLDDMPAARDDHLPPTNSTTIRVLTYAGPYAITAPEKDFGRNRHSLSPLFHAAQEVITQIRLLGDGRSA